jgi:hypothetical protein
VLGLSHRLDNLPVLADDFENLVELLTLDDVDDFLKNLSEAVEAAGYIRITTPDLRPLNTPSNTLP